ncbi:Ig-like domain-containing protein [Variovorax arabinosiphilus]|nr:Ig-like domain-containing protein [Variovorax sp. J2L1-78]MDM0122662.1 Ig-like domain-containing protein [Variovorax sp. J2L1-78]
MLLAFLLFGCGGGGGGGLDPILGPPVLGVPPTVSATSPAASEPPVSGVAISSSVQATFSKRMSADSLTASSFTLACPAGASMSATVTYDAASSTATLTPTAALPPGTLCVATVTTAARDTTGLALAANFSWQFRTAGLPDTTRPTVIFTVPVPTATGVVTNTRITATFSEAMRAASLTADSFVVTGGSPASPIGGTVSYSASSRTATFTPTAATLPVNTVFTATVTTTATDAAGNALAGNTAVAPNAGNHVWTFTTGSTADAIPPTVLVVNPVAGATAVCRTQSINASFSEPMDPASIDTTTFRVTENGVAVSGAVSYDASNRIATFSPTAATGFSANVALSVTVASGAAGVRDLAGNPLAADQVWSFSTGTQACAPPIDLQSIAGFGAFGGGAGVTNQGINTVIGGNLGTTAACTLVTGLHDRFDIYTETPLNVGAVDGTIYCAPPAPGTVAKFDIATQARADAQASYNQLAALPAGSDPGAGQLGGLVLPPAVYTAAGGTFAITSGDLTLDALGDANATWVFQSSAAMTIGLPGIPRRVFLINGAKASNVFWQVGSAGRIEDGSTMVGTIIAPAGITISTAGQTVQTTLTGRAIGLTASVTMVNTTIVAP